MESLYKTIIRFVSFTVLFELWLMNAHVKSPNETALLAFIMTWIVDPIIVEIVKYKQ
jgi:hypothetical protein